MATIIEQVSLSCGRSVLHRHANYRLHAFKDGQKLRECTRDPIVSALFDKLWHMINEPHCIDFEGVEYGHKADCEISLRFGLVEVFQKDGEQFAEFMGTRFKADELTIQLALDICEQMRNSASLWLEDDFCQEMD